MYMELVCYNLSMKLQDLSKQYLKELRIRMETKYKVMSSGCWEWQEGRFPYGYGKISVKHLSWGAHRVYYQLVRGFISDDLVVSHECDNPPCINPDHLKATTQWENNARGVGVSAENLRKTCCVNGHKFTVSNTIIGRNRRSCRSCTNAHAHRRDIQRTLEYHVRGLNSKGRPLKRKIDHRFV